MKTNKKKIPSVRFHLIVLSSVWILAGVANLMAQTGNNPWEDTSKALERLFTGPIAVSLSSVAIVVGGLTWAFDSTHDKRMLAGIVFGCGMALGAVQLMHYLFV